MTKRFTLEKEQINSTSVGRIYDNKHILAEFSWDTLPNLHLTELEILCDKLNEQDQRIKELEEENKQLNADYKATHGTIWEQEQQPSDCLKCKHIQKIQIGYEVGLPVAPLYACLKNKYEDKMAHTNYYCDTYEEKKEE